MSTRQVIWQVLVVTVKKRHEEPPGESNSRISRSRHATVVMSEIPDWRTGVDVFLHDLRRVVSRAVINDDRLPVGLDLFEQRPDGAIDQVTALVGTDHHTEEGNMHTPRIYDLCSPLIRRMGQQ